VGKGASPRRGLSIASLLLLCVVPGFAAVSMDPGAAVTIWHIVAAGVVAALLQWQRIGDWLRQTAGIRSRSSFGFAFALCFSALSTPLALLLVDDHPLPRFNDIFLVGIVLTCYLFSWQPAAFQLVVSALVTAWVLPPSATLRVEGFNEWYRLISFTVVSVFMIVLITRMKARQLDVSFRSNSVAAGD
jgi:hypothetical protein